MKYLFGLFIICFACNSLADSYYVYPTKTMRTDPGLADTVGELVSSAVSELGHEVVEKRSEAQYTLRVKVGRLGQSYIVTLKKYKDRKTKYSGKLKAQGEEELDTVTSRLVRSAIKGDSGDTSQRVGQITNQEVDQVSKRTESRHYNYFAIGPFKLTNVENDELAYYISYGHFWEVSPNAALKILGEGALQTGGEVASFMSLSLGVNYYLTPASTSFYLGADLGYGASIAKAVDNTGGFALGGSLGMIFFRTAGTQMSVALRAQTIFSENEKGNPGLMGLSLGFHY